MKAFVVDKYKKKVPLRLADMPDPVIGANDVLVRIEATAINLLDSKVRDGEFKLFLPYRPPFILGHDLAGTVIHVGANVRQFKSGDEIYARPRDGRIGTFAEMIAVDASDLALKPKSLSMEQAASIPLVGLTAWQALVEVGKVKPGQKVFIQAGSGGVGTFAIQLAKHLGATVATTTSTANIELVKSLGADVVIDYKRQDFEQVLSGYDLALNSQDAKTLAKSVNVLKPGWQANLDLWSAGRPFREVPAAEPHTAPCHADAEPRHSEEGKEPGHRLFLPLHAGGRPATARDCQADR